MYGGARQWIWKSPALAPAALRPQLLLGLEQGCDTILPQVETKRQLAPFAQRELDSLAAGTRCLLAHPGATTLCPRAVAGTVTLALGPEGGIIDCDLDLFVRHGFEPITLGRRSLRVEQAVAALIARTF